MSEKTGTFLVTHVEDSSAVLSDVTNAQVHTLSSNPGVEEGEVLEATVAPDPPLEVTWSVVDVESRRTIPVEVSSETPTTHAYDMAEGLGVGNIETMERAGTGEVHVLVVPEDETESAVEEVKEDVATLERAARIGINRVEIRFDDGIVSVRYMP